MIEAAHLIVDHVDTALCKGRTHLGDAALLIPVREVIVIATHRPDTKSSSQAACRVRCNLDKCRAGVDPITAHQGEIRFLPIDKLDDLASSRRVRVTITLQVTHKHDTQRAHGALANLIAMHLQVALIEDDTSRRVHGEARDDQ